MSNRYWSKWGDEDGQTVGYAKETIVDQDKEISRLIGLSSILLEALKYARRFLNEEDHDVGYVDTIIAEAEGVISDE